MEAPINGVYAASLTPLTSKLEPNIPELIDHVLWLLDSGADGVALLGSTGEANSMTLEQRLSIIKKSANKLPKQKLIIGTGSCALGEAIKLTQTCIDEGFLSVLLLPPFYYKPQSDENILRFFSELISIVNEPKLRIIFYNFPKLTGYNFSLNILKEFKKEFGNISAGIKDSSGDWSNIVNLVNNIPDFKVYAGNEKFLLDTLKIGGSGCISASANLTAINCGRVFKAWKNKKNKKAMEDQQSLSILRGVLENHSFVSGLKSLFASKSNVEGWENMLPPFSPLLKKQLLSIQLQLKEVGFDLENIVRKN
tara:strand:+ start:821 stop:1747 length:927 start_codon:yes stop_codon:yes gene_type:complete